MADFLLPFPSRELAAHELSKDPCYERIPVNERSRLVTLAWEKGSAAAHALYDKEEGSYDFTVIARSHGLEVIRKDIDYIVGTNRYFSEYISGQGRILLYMKSIALWAEENNLAHEDAVNVILSHEFFHFLEWTSLGLTSKNFLVPMLTIGPLKIGRTGIRALSEIGAHAFSRTYYERVVEEKE